MTPVFRNLVLSFAVTLTIAWAAILLFFLQLPAEAGGRGPLILVPVSFLVLFFLHLMIGLGVFVYRDAKSRGMEPLLWALVAVLVPYFVGVIIYLIVRQQALAQCPSCGQRMTPGATYCPACGKPMRMVCQACKAAVPAGARFCPACGAAAAA